MKIRFWDLETFSFSFKADAGGHILCGSWMDFGESKPHCLGIDDFPRYRKNSLDDSRLVLALRKVLEEADVWVTWYGSKFDEPFLNSRLIHHGYAPLPPRAHIDLWFTARYRLAISRNSLANASRFLGLEQKTPLMLEEWVKAVAGERRSLRYIKEHCDQDVVVLSQAYKVLRPLIKNHPSVAEAEKGVIKCTACGSFDLQKRGFRATPTSRRRVYFCKKCHSWPVGRTEKT